MPQQGRLLLAEFNMGSGTGTREDAVFLQGIAITILFSTTGSIMVLGRI